MLSRPPPPRPGRAVGRSGGAVSPEEEATKVAAASAISADHNRSDQVSYSLEETSATMEGPRDEALMAAYQKGDGRAFDTLFSRYQDRVFGYFVRIFGDRSLAEDLFQRTFLHVHRARADYDPARPFVSWLFSIASNLSKDEVKHRARRPGDANWSAPEDAPVRPAGGTDPEARLLAQERSARVKGALAKLPDSQREVIILHKLEGLSFPEIADALGEEVEAVKARAFRGYRALREHLAEGDAP